MQKKLQKIYFDFQILAFELVAWNTRFYWEREYLSSGVILLTKSLLLDETHLEAVRGFMQLRGFTSVHQQVELVGAMWLRSTRTNRSAYCLCQGLDSKLKNLD